MQHEKSERTGWSIKEWAAANGFSRWTWHRMPVADRPLTIKIGSREIITKAAHEQWQAMMLERARLRRESGEAA